MVPNDTTGPNFNFLSDEYKRWISGAIRLLSRAELVVQNTARKGVENQIAQASDVAAKPTRYRPAPCKPPTGKQRRQWK